MSKNNQELISQAVSKIKEIWKFSLGEEFLEIHTTLSKSNLADAIRQGFQNNSSNETRYRFFLRMQDGSFVLRAKSPFHNATEPRLYARIIEETAGSRIEGLYSPTLFAKGFILLFWILLICLPFQAWTYLFSNSSELPSKPYLFLMILFGHLLFAVIGSALLVAFLKFGSILAQGQRTAIESQLRKAITEAE